jgi:hypothetical protein
MLDHQTYDKTRGGCGCGDGRRFAPPVGGGTVTDPVCGMEVDPVTSTHHLEQGGHRITVLSLYGLMPFPRLRARTI